MVFVGRAGLRIVGGQKIGGNGIELIMRSRQRCLASRYFWGVSH